MSVEQLIALLMKADPKAQVAVQDTDWYWTELRQVYFDEDAQRLMLSAARG